METSVWTSPVARAFAFTFVASAVFLAIPMGYFVVSALLERGATGGTVLLESVRVIAQCVAAALFPSVLAGSTFRNPRSSWARALIFGAATMASAAILVLGVWFLREGSGA